MDRNQFSAVAEMEPDFVIVPYTDITRNRDKLSLHEVEPVSWNIGPARKVEQLDMFPHASFKEVGLTLVPFENKITNSSSILSVD